MIPGMIVKIALKKSDTVLYVSCVATDELSTSIAKDVILKAKDNGFTGISLLSDRSLISRYAQRRFINIGNMNSPEADDQPANIVIDVGNGNEDKSLCFESVKDERGYFIFERQKIIETIRKELSLAD